MGSEMVSVQSHHCRQPRLAWVLTTTMLSATNGGHLSVPTLSPVLTASSFGLPLPYPFHSHQLFRVAVRCPPPPLLPVPVLQLGGISPEGRGRGGWSKGRRPGWASGISCCPLGGAPLWLGLRVCGFSAFIYPRTQRSALACAGDALAPTAVRTHAQLHKDVHTSVYTLTQRHRHFPDRLARTAVHSHWHALACTR